MSFFRLWDVGIQTHVMYGDSDHSDQSVVAVWTPPAGYMGDMGDMGYIEDGPRDWVLRCMVVTGHMDGGFNVLGKTLLEHHNMTKPNN